MLNIKKQIIYNYNITHTTPLNIKITYTSFTNSLLNLTKHPSSTIQILKTEKTLFKTLKTKHNTPKYNLIYHTSLIEQTNQKLKKKINSYKNTYIK